MTKKIALIIEHENGNIKPSIYELLSMAKRISTREECEIFLVIIGEESDKRLKSISANTGCDIYAVSTPGLKKYKGSLCKEILLKFFCKESFDYICAPHSISGMDYAPALSIDLKAPCITSVEDVLFEEGKIYFVRSMFGGKLSAKFAKGECPVILTIQPGSFKPFFSVKTDSGKVIKMVFECGEGDIEFTGTRVSPSLGSELDKADVIVSGGRGIGEKENYKYIELMAKVFKRSAPGASRPICDYGWATYSKQVGITGTLVSPKLYIACGISGASQHVEGMRGSQFIVAINTDPDAPVFQIADICVVADTIEFIRLFVKKAKNRNSLP